MKNLTKNAIGRIFVPVLVIVALGLGSCNKEHGIGSTSPSDPDAITKAKKTNLAVQKALKGFVTTQAGGSGQQNSVASSGGNTFSNVTKPVVSYPAAGKTVYTWSDPSAPGTSYKLTESSGGGLGAITVNGKTFEYNYVLSVKASSTDPTWSSLLEEGFILIAALAIEGDLASGEYTIKGFGEFFAWETSDAGTYNFGMPSSGSSTSVYGFVFDFSDMANATLASLGGSNLKMYFSSGGHIAISETAIEMASDAKVIEHSTQTEYPIEGALMFE